MKKMHNYLSSIFLLTLLVMSGATAIAQVDRANTMDTFLYSGNRSQKMNGLPDNYSGSPYLNERFTTAIINHDGNSTKAFARYNAYNDKFEVKKTYDEDGFLELKRSKDITISLSGKTFTYKQYEVEGSIMAGYLNVIYTFKNGSYLAEKIEKVFEPAEQAQSSYQRAKPARFDDEMQLLFVEENQQAHEISNDWRSLRREFKEHSREIRKYVKSNDVEFEDNYRGLVEVLRHIQSLQS